MSEAVHGPDRLQRGGGCLRAGDPRALAGDVDPDMAGHETSGRKGEDLVADRRIVAPDDPDMRIILGPDRRQDRDDDRQDLLCQRIPRRRRRSCESPAYSAT